MDTNISNSSDSAVPAQTPPPEVNSSNVNNAAQQLETSVSRFSQGAQRNQESLIALIKQVSEQLRAIDAKAQKNSAELEKQKNWILNNRR